MQERKGALPGIKNAGKKKTSLEGIKKAENNRSSSALPIMQYFGEVQPSRRIIKADGTIRQDADWSMPTIKKYLKPGFSSTINYRSYVRPSAYTTESLAFFTAIEDAGGTLTDNVKAEFNAFVVREKDAGRWDKYIALFPFLGGTLDGGIIDAKNLLVADKTGSNLVDADFGDVIGVTGDGTSKRLDTTLIAANIFDSNTDLQIGVFTGKANTSNGFFIGAGNSTPSTTMLWFNNVNAYYGNYQTIPKAVTDSNDSSFFAFIGGQAFTMENGVSSTKITPVSYDLPTTSFGILTRRFNNSWSSGYNDGTINGAFFAKGMSEAELTDFDASYKTFVNNIITYAASQAYFSAVTASGGTLTENVQAEFTSFVSREVEAGRWSKIKRLYPFLGGTVNSAIIDAKTLNSAISVNFVDADADATIGLQGDGTSKYLNTDALMNSIVANNYNWQTGYFIIGNVPTLTSLVRPMGYYRSTGTRGAIYLQIDTSKRPSAFGNWSGISTGSTASLVSNSSHFGARFSNTELIIMQDGVKKNTNVTADADVLIDVPVTMFGFQINGVYQSFSPMNHSGYFIAEGMTEADLTAFDTSYKTFITNITA